MTHAEKIAVIQHHADGGEVEYKRNLNEQWLTMRHEVWNFAEYEYRIKEKPKTKTVWFWKVKGELGNWFIDTDHAYSEEEIMKVYPVALEYKRMDILGSEEVPND